MQTFLPYSSFRASAACLDRARLGKQRVETKQLLLALGIPVGEHAAKPASSWRNHPAAKMWQRYPIALAQYGAAVCREWRDRGYRDTLLEQFEDAWHAVAWAEGNGAMPPWIGDEALHASHRSNLLRKSPEWYGRFGWAEPADLPYVWPCA